MAFAYKASNNKCSSAVKLKSIPSQNLKLN